MRVSGLFYIISAISSVVLGLLRTVSEQVTVSVRRRSTVSYFTRSRSTSTARTSPAWMRVMCGRTVVLYTRLSTVLLHLYHLQLLLSLIGSALRGVLGYFEYRYSKVPNTSGILYDMILYILQVLPEHSLGPMNARDCNLLKLNPEVNSCLRISL